MIRWRGRAPDRRGGRIVAVIECVLNQNARAAGAARFPAMNAAVLDILRAYDVGIVQMPCPEMACLGLGRQRPPGVSLRAALEAPEERRCCRFLAEATAERIDAYCKGGVAVLAVLGGDVASPGCAVHLAQNGMTVTERSGVFIQELCGALLRRKLEIAFRGLRESDPAAFEEDLAWLHATVAARQ